MLLEDLQDLGRGYNNTGEEVALKTDTISRKQTPPLLSVLLWRSDEVYRRLEKRFKTKVKDIDNTLKLMPSQQHIGK
uniref:Uncharacterized protein n=1 Tax=Rhizophagus irregularis (strain DAOM 181602 / DAOM 197198 / MUCL 43194) TaxID=747089 RepID=U9U0L7_RHIID